MITSPFLLVSCPPAASIETVNIPECFEDFGQIQKILPQRLYSGATKNQISVASAELLATWTPLLTASDSTKVVVSPTVYGSVITPGEKNEWGSGNEVPGGRPIALATAPSVFNGSFRLVAQESIKSLKKLRQERELGVYLVNEFGQIAGSEDASGELHPFPIYSFFVGDKGTGNRDEPDMNAVSFYLAAEWSDNFKVIQPSDFNAISDLDQTA